MKVKFARFNKAWGRKRGKNPLKRLFREARIDDQFHRYYNIHHKYIYNLLEYCGAEIEMVDTGYFSFHHKVVFELELNGELCLVDFNNYEDIPIEYSRLSNYKAIFKLHYNNQLHDVYPNIFPFSTVSYHDWQEYYGLADSIEYQAAGKILNRQVPHSRNIERRSRVRAMLLAEYGDELAYEEVDKSQYFREAGACLTSVCVPGAFNNSLDRGQNQFMGLGVCTLSPRLSAVMSWDIPVVPDEHYLKCADDYHDLIDVIEGVRENRSRALEIGQQAKELFLSTSTPQRQVEWIEECLGRSSPLRLPAGTIPETNQDEMMS